MSEVGDPPRVLVVEDEDDWSRAARLRATDMSVLVSEGRSRALERLSPDDDVSCVVADADQLETSPLEFLNDVRAIDPAVGVVVVSGDEVVAKLASENSPVADRACEQVLTEDLDPRSIDRIKDPAMTLTRDGRILACNRAAVDYLDLEDDPAGVVAWPELPKADGESLAVVAERAIETGGTRRREVHDRRRCGWFEFTVYPHGDRVTLVATRIDERKEWERDLDHYRWILESLADPIYALEPDGTVAYVNEAAATILDRPKSAIVDHDFTELVQSSTTDGSRDWVDRLLSSDRTEDTFEQVIETGIGEMVTVENHVTVAESEGAFEGAVGILRDVTERKTREAELEQYETIVHALSAPVYATDADGYFTFVNQTFAEFTNYDPEDILDGPMHFEELVTDESVDRIYDVVRCLLSDSTGRRRATVGIQVETRDGRQIPVVDSLAVLPYDEEFNGVAGVVRDVSDRKQEQQRLEVMNRVLRHNVRNQMNVIGGSAETIVEMSDDPTVVEIARSIVEASSEMTKVSNNVRDLQQAIDREEEGRVDLTRAVESVLSGQREAYPDVAIVADVPDALPVGCGRSIVYALEHLVENAVEHNDKATPRVELTVRPDPSMDGWARVDIADNGPGIPEQDRKVVTGDVEADPLQHGSGLGLWIVNWIVESHGGRIEIENPDDGGTVVSVVLPTA